MQSEEVRLNMVNVSAVLTSTGRSFHHRGARTESSRERDKLNDTSVQIFTLLFSVLCATILCKVD